MRIRWKVLILLLVTGLAPLGIAFWVGRGAAVSLRSDLVSRTREMLVADAEGFLLQTVRDHARLLQLEAESLSHNLQIQAREVERCLASTVPGPVGVHFVGDFEKEGVLPELVTSVRYMRMTPDGELLPVPISYENQGFMLAPGTSENEVREDLARLSAILPTYQLIHRALRGRILWQFTALNNGIHSAYPGHGHYPAGFDPRRRPWFIAAQQREEMVWCPPNIDAATRQAVLTISMPVYRPDRSFAGVTGMDVRIVDMVNEVELPEQWAPSAETMIVVPVLIDPMARPVMVVVARHDLATGTEWDAPIAASSRTLMSEDRQQLAEVTDDLSRERAATRYLRHKGRRSLWVYGPLPGTRAALLVIVPYEDLLAPVRSAEDQVRERLADHRSLMTTITACVLVAVLLLSMLASRLVTRPIRELAAAAHRIADGDLETTARITTRDELGELGTTVNAMLPQLRDRMKLRHSLALAMEVQQSLLPQEPPHVEGLDIAGKSIYCDETGGDYYDFIDLSEITPHTLGVAVGDVTGHGIAAALLMATARALLRSRVDEPGDLGELLNHMNRHLAKDVPVGKFMTLCYLLLDTRENTVRWSSAGHDPAIVFTPSDGGFSELSGGGIPLGIEPSWQYEEFGPQQLEPGQVIVVGTDGIWETRDERREMFGKQRLREIIREAAGGSAHEISDAITDGIAGFRAGKFPADDITLAVIKIADRSWRAQFQPGETFATM